MTDFDQVCEDLLQTVLLPLPYELRQYDVVTRKHLKLFVAKIEEVTGMKTRVHPLGSRFSGCYARGSRDFDALLELSAPDYPTVLAAFSEALLHIEKMADRVSVGQRGLGWTKVDIWREGFLYSLVPIPDLDRAEATDAAAATMKKLASAVLAHPSFARHLTAEQRRHVLLGKFFFKVAGCYRKKAFGFLIEVMIHRVGSFKALINALAEGRRVFADNPSHAGSGAIVVPDPGFPHYNLAMALTEEDFVRLMALARRVAEEPEALLELKPQYEAAKTA